MVRHSHATRTPGEIRASNVRLGLILLAIAAVFFAGVVIKQCYFA
jgi:hypothetical protein